jgi:hypothetical protein
VQRCAALCSVGKRFGAFSCYSASSSCVVCLCLPLLLLLLLLPCVAIMDDSSDQWIPSDDGDSVEVDLYQVLGVTRLVWLVYARLPIAIHLHRT